VRNALAAAILCTLTVVANPAMAQTVQATLTGRVLDSSGAAVANVPVLVKNVDTNQVTRALTEAGGKYTAPFLPPGKYSVTVEAPGFKRLVRENLILNISQTATVDLTLEVGGVTEQVTVTAETPLLETAKADRGGVIDRERVHELPLNGRNPFMLAKLVAGVNFNGQLIWERPFDNGAMANWSVNGGRASTNEFLLDGAPNNAMAGSNNIAYVPPVDSVQEFKIQTNSYDSQYGHTGGGIINVSLKSGTNQLHGTVYEFARRKAWDANSFQNNAQGLPKDAHYLDQFGWQVQGPILIPKLYDGRNKSFFMFNYEGYREGTPRPQTLSVPAKEFLDGDFSKNVDGQGRLITIFNPASGHDVNGVWTRDPFVGNRIPQQQINPIGKKILGFFPTANVHTSADDYTVNNYYFAGADALDKDRFYNLVIKFDQQFGSKHHMFFRHGSNDRTQRAFDDSNAIVGPGARGSLPEKRINDAYVLDWVGVLTPRTVANARVSFARYLEQDRSDQNQGYDMTQLGFPPSLVSQLPGGPFFGVYNITDYQTLGRYPSGSITNTVSFQPNISRTSGAHSMKAGVDMRWIQYIATSLGNPLNLTANRAATQRDFNRGDGLSGNTAASFLLGTLSSGSSDLNLLPTYLYRYYAPWFQDDWRVNRRLTLNLGLRWDFNVPANERYNRMNRGFDLTLTNPVDKLIDRTKFPGFPTVLGGLLFAGVNGQPRNAAETYRKAVQPRFGFAYQLSSKLVMRGGWGRYYSNPSNSYLQSFGFNNSTAAVTSPDGGRTPTVNLLSDPFPNGLQPPPGSSLGPLTFLGRALSYVRPEFKLPRVDQFSFGFQYELFGNTKVEASYVGSRSNNLQSSAGINTYDLAFRKQCNLMEGGNPLFCDQLLPNPFAGLSPFLGTSLYSNATISRATLANPYPAFGGLTEQMRNDGKVWYNSLQVTYEVRLRGDLNVLANYTLSKSIDQDGNFNDFQNRVLQRSVSQYDRPHNITVASVYSLPFGKGKKFLGNANGLVNRLVGGWQNTVTFTYTSGLPWALPSNVIYVKDATLPDIDWSAPVVRAITPCVAQWNDNGSITMQPFSVSAGCTSYNFLIAPRYAPRFTPSRDPRLRLHSPPTADISFNKTTAIKERMRIQFRAEAFNITNTYWFGRQQFNSTATSSAFGTLNKASIAFTNTNQPRYVQLAVKFLW
jgi:hypothetical protein